ncbi:FG-GAP repeat domain-containing protein [Tenggerimyces flavus]|uniref:FG-GAP repeat domain-containing protein n=1 Tax=Tenggerimyces flavus TaxID=1708749 RepID=A0ABV7YD49_9ACTN|nr:VCBS repeat-containing protein [Tenggerimyces flavus]
MLAALGTAAALAAALVIGPPAHAVPPTPTFPATIDAYAVSDDQTRCIDGERPGVADFRNLLEAEYGRADLGIHRPCAQGGTSEHKEGRALDYPFNVTNATQKAQADQLLAWLLATDQYGNKHALARRLGIMYMIWNHKIWRAYRPNEGWLPYGGPNPHTDHIHFSFGWPGARQETTWWTLGGSPGGPAESVNGDKFDDMLAVTASDELRMYPGRVSAEFGQSVRIGPGWSTEYNRLGTSDVDGDGLGDIVGTSEDGGLHYWHNNGTGTSYSKSTNVGAGWKAFEWLTFVDLTGDNKADIVARDGDQLYWWRGAGNGTYGPKLHVGAGWATFPEFGGGDADGDGDGDLWGTDEAGRLFFWRGNGAGGFATKIEAGSGWNVFGPFNVMDINGDGKADLVAANAAGDLFRWLGKGDGKFNAAGPRIGFGWTDIRIASY